ncbi:MAG: TlpA family protein disulfide reductase [Gammaproteobacteria bacterium]|nr:TlpA family protein disulfide reductase [Gammaproteobacteria bacterium]
MIVLTACDPAPSVIDSPAILPELSLQTLEHEIASINILESDALVLNIWAVWCGPCRQEMPALQVLSNWGKEHNISVISLAVEEDANLVKEFLYKYQIHVPAYLISKQEAEKKLGLVAYPLTLVVAKDGRIMARLNGAYEWDNEQVYRLLTQLVLNSEADVNQFENFRMNDPVE